MSLLDIMSLTVRYENDAVVDDLSFSVNAGESVGLVGESGSGKTQTALAILGLLPRNAMVGGSIKIEGKELRGASEQELNAIRARRISIVFQDPMLALNPYLRIGEQIGRIMITHEIADGAAAEERVVEMLDAVGSGASGSRARVRVMVWRFISVLSGPAAGSMDHEQRECWVLERT